MNGSRNNRSFFRLESRVTFHYILQMLIDKGVKPGKVVFIIDDGWARVLVGGEIDEIFCFLLIELNARSF